METNTEIPVFCVNFKNEPRRQRMIQRFQQVNIKATFLPVIEGCCMSNHMNVIQYFVNHSELGSYVVLCEDDIYLHKELKLKINQAAQLLDQHQLDIILLGYLINNNPHKQSNYYQLIDSYDGGTLFNYHEELWGTQMFIITRDYAKKLCQMYPSEYKKQSEQPGFVGKPYAADWTITKLGKRALMFPMAAVEEGTIAGTHQGQIDFHRSCKESNYNKRESWDKIRTIAYELSQKEMVDIYLTYTLFVAIQSPSDFDTTHYDSLRGYEEEDRRESKRIINSIQIKIKNMYKNKEIRTE